EVADDFRDKLKEAIQQLVNGTKSDSPVYTCLPNLIYPQLRETFQTTVAATAPAPSAGDQTASLLMKMFRDARAASNWVGAKMALEQLKIKMPGDPFVVQQLALATYKSKQPDAKAALAEARNTLSELHPETTNDPETLGIWGAIHKRMWELDGKRDDLDEAVR